MLFAKDEKLKNGFNMVKKQLTQEKKRYIIFILF